MGKSNILILGMLVFYSLPLQSQQGTITFYDTATSGTNTIGPHDSNRSVRINGEKNVDIVIDEQSQYSDGAFNIFRDGPSATPLFQVTRDGNVAIGKAATTSVLDVAGNIKATEHITVNKNGSYRVAMNGQGHGYITGRNEQAENRFYIHSNGSSWFNGGNVGIGTSSPDSKLTVKGQIHTQEVKVDLNGAVAPDYVFKEGYKLKTLEEVQEYIDKKGHLPNIPSAQEMEENGLLLKEMNLKLLEKIEELTLYTISQNIELTRLANQVDEKNENIKTLELEYSRIVERLKTIEKAITR